MGVLPSWKRRAPVVETFPGLLRNIDQSGGRGDLQLVYTLYLLLIFAPDTLVATINGGVTIEQRQLLGNTLYMVG
jgi:hypothetical protein